MDQVLMEKDQEQGKEPEWEKEVEVKDGGEATDRVQARVGNAFVPIVVQSGRTRLGNPVMGLSVQNADPK